MHRADTDTSALSVLALLRELVPARPLRPFEAYRIAELQASLLLKHFKVTTNAVPEQIIAEVPRVRVVRERGLPMSGLAHWNGRYWIITLSADEHPLRQRFSLMHEFKHVLDHTSKDLLYRDWQGSSAYHHAERVADYFAACVLMPKRVVRRLWAEGHQDVAGLARILQVSQAALRYRLYHLRISEQPFRCGPPPGLSSAPGKSQPRHYMRAALALTGECR